MHRFYVLIGVVIAMLLTTSVYAERTDLYGRRSSLFELLPVDSTNIVFFGNSLTEGCEWNELLANPKVLNRGITGDTADGLMERIQSVVTGQPAKVFLLIGINDVSHDLSADSIATVIEALVTELQVKSPRTKVYLQSLLPINNNFGRYRLLKDKEQVIRDINAQLAPMARRHGITYIDLYPAFCDDDNNLRNDLTNDGLHLMGAGYIIWRDIIKPYVDE